MMLSGVYHLCLHGVLVGIIVVLLREYYSIYAHHYKHNNEVFMDEAKELGSSSVPRQPIGEPASTSKAGQSKRNNIDCCLDTEARRADKGESCTVDISGDKLYSTGNINSKHCDKTTLNDNTRIYASNSVVSSEFEVRGSEQTTNADDLYHSSAVVERGSSVWCTGTDHTHRHCRFHNLCFLPQHDSFVFLHTRWSVVDGVPQDRFSPALLDLSSVQDHNTQYFNYVDLSASAIRDVPIQMVEEPVLVFHRFNADNLMHVFHDDLLPLFSTLQMINTSNVQHNQPFSVRLLAMEGWEPGNYKHLYQIMSSYPVMYKDELISRSHVTCFSNAYLGLHKHTTWYQYGFKVPQGPLTGYSVTSREVRQFTEYFKARLDLISSKQQTENYVVLFTRKHNRIILNEISLILELSKKYNMKVYNVGTETHSVSEMVKLIESATVLVGMHGSLLVLSMFLPPGAVLVELFPYAVNADNYTPYKTLASLHGMNIVYKSWTVTRQEDTVVHPDRPWDTGGIQHLPEFEQLKIQTSDSVPQHLCCRDPEWLYRIYQDTTVDIPSLFTVIDSAMRQRQTLLLPTATATAASSPAYPWTPSKLYPASVSNIVCVGSGDNGAADSYGMNEPHPALEVSWDEPWNLQHVQLPETSYEVWIQESGYEHYSAWILTRTQHRFTLGLKPNTQYSIWIRCIIDNHVLGPFNHQHITCNT